MKSFRFSLQAVLTLREQAEQTAQQNCAAAYAAVKAAAARLRAVEESIDACEVSRRTQLIAGTMADQIEQSRRYAALLEEHRVRLDRELADACRRADEAWQQLVVAAQRREGLERLRGKQRRVYEYQAARAEQKLLDEFAGRRALFAQAWRENTVDL